MMVCTVSSILIGLGIISLIRHVTQQNPIQSLSVRNLKMRIIIMMNTCCKNVAITNAERIAFKIFTYYTTVHCAVGFIGTL